LQWRFRSPRSWEFMMVHGVLHLGRLLCPRAVAMGLMMLLLMHARRTQYIARGQRQALLAARSSPRSMPQTGKQKRLTFTQGLRASQRDRPKHETWRCGMLHPPPRRSLSHMGSAYVR